MKKFTKWLSLVLVLAMVASIMVGCVKTPATSNPNVENPTTTKKEEPPHHR